jgi:tetratricopeptide (TPR) repeat protein
LRLGGIAIRQADYIHAQTLICQAMQCLSMLDEPHLMARAQLFLSQIAALRGGLEATTYYLSLAAGAQGRGREPDPSDVRIAGVYQEWLGTVFVMDRSLPALAPDGELGGRSADDLECLLWLAEVAVQRGTWGEALGLLRRSMALGWARGTRLDVADAKRVLAWLLMHAGAYQEANDYIDEALATFAEASWTTGLADGYWLAGEILLALGRLELAAERFDQALRLGKETHTVPAVVRAQIGLGKLAAARAQWQEGKRWCTEARARAAWAKLGPCAVSARLGLARAYLNGHEWQLARGQAKQALDLGCQLGFPSGVLDAAWMLGEALLGLGQIECAQGYFRQAYDVAVQLAGTLPLHYAGTFWSRPSIESLRDRMAG